MLFVESIKNSNSKISNIFKKLLVLSIICSNCGNEDEEEGESIKILKTFGLIKNI